MAYLHQRVEETPMSRVRQAAQRVRPRHKTTTPGSWVLNFAALGKAIFLCGLCKNKFDYRKHGYIQARRPPFQEGAIADCDGCSAPMERCSVFLIEKGD